MSLNATEVAYARKLLAQGERQWRNWGVVRWLVLVGGVLLFVGGVGAVLAGQREPEDRAAEPATRAAVVPVTPPVVTSEVARTRTEMVAFVLQTSLLNSLGMALIATGIVACGFSLTHWNTHLRDALLCKAIREKFADTLVAA